MKRIVQICLIMTGIFWGVFNVYGSSTYQILKDQQIEFTDILVEGDSLVLVRNEKNGFSSEVIYLGVYNCVERMWTVEYQAYDEYLESSYYAGDGIFALSDGETTTLLNTKTQEFLKLDINVNFNNLYFYNGCAVSGARESYGDQLYGIYEIDEDGNYQNTGITDYITEDKILRPDDFEFVYADGKQAVYIYDGEEFYIYDVAAAEVYDIYNPDYADKFWHGWTDTLKVSIFYKSDTEAETKNKSNFEFEVMNYDPVLPVRMKTLKIRKENDKLILELTYAEFEWAGIEEFIVDIQLVRYDGTVNTFVQNALFEKKGQNFARFQLQDAGYDLDGIASARVNILVYNIYKSQKKHVEKGSGFSAYSDYSVDELRSARFANSNMVMCMEKNIGKNHQCCCGQVYSNKNNKCPLCGKERRDK